MARLEAIAVGGYYKTPESLLAPIAARLGIRERHRYSFLDPCAGDGEALSGILQHLYKRAYPEQDKGLCPTEYAPKIYAVEMEATRYGMLRERLHSLCGYVGFESLHGDSFQVSAKTHGSDDPQEINYRGVQLLYLNPPYDHDYDYKRLEERFLARWTPSLCEGGILVFVVPFHALKASAETLATHYATIKGFRFPAGEWDAFKQVVIYARKRPAPLMVADPELQERVLAWAEDPTRLPELMATDKVLGMLPDQPRRTVPTWNNNTREDFGLVGFSSFNLMPLDVATLLSRYRAWHATDRGGVFQPLSAVMSDPALDAIAERKFPTAMPPKPAHIAAGIAAGVFNGERISPDDPASGAPDLLVKGVFDREFHTVDEKTNKAGDVVGLVQVQQPKLVVTVLDLSTRLLHEVTPSVETTGTTDPAKMTTGDLLTLYGKALLKILRDHCPVLYDPADVAQHFPLPAFKRELYTAQAHVVRANLMLLGGPGLPVSHRKGRAVVTLGEIGCGKTSVAIATAIAAGARRVLVLCPPHLLDTWRDQIATVYPAASSHVLRSVSDVQAFEALSSPEIAFGILSREAAKLGHGWASVTRLTPNAQCACPKCGALLPEKVDFSKKRERCASAPLVPTSEAGEVMLHASITLVKLKPRNPHIYTALQTRPLLRLRLKYLTLELEAETSQTVEALRAAHYAALRASARATELAWKIAELALNNRGYYGESHKDEALLHYLAGLDLPELTAAIADGLYTAAALFRPGSYGAGESVRSLAKELLLLLPPGCEAQSALIAKWRGFPEERGLYSYGAGEGWNILTQKILALQGKPVTTPNHHWHSIQRGETGVCYRNHPVGFIVHFDAALTALSQLGGWARSEECGEPLFQAVAEPMRYPLATYISRYAAESFDFLILDEGHEYSTDGSAQERAAHRLTGLKKPTVLLTGSIMNGYAESLFANWWALFPSFRREFARSERGAFVDRYGYRKRLLQDADKKTGEVIAYGSMSDRVEKRERDMGNAPGVFPLFILKMLKDCTTLHKTDLKLDLPPCREIPVVVEPAKDQSGRHKALVEALFTQVKRDRFTALAGKLWGQVSEVPSHLDRCTDDAGNTSDGAYEARYPESEGSRLVARAEPFSRLHPLPKEALLLDTIANERAEGRNVLVLTWHVELMPRLQRLVRERFGWKNVPVLDPSKVPTAKREAWITKQVVDADAPVMFTNPVCVQTGLNNLVHFASEWWHENPACNPIIYRQAVGRVDRIGQKAHETRIYFPRYAVPSQGQAHRLLLHKVGVSMSTDGLDAESALQAAGVGETGFSGFSVGRELYNLIEAEIGTNAA